MANKYTMTNKDTMASRFSGIVNGKRKTKQVITAEQAIQTRRQARAKLANFLREVYESIPELDSAYAGPNKKPWVAELKAARDYGDDMTFICDFVRGMIVCNDARQAKTVFKILSNSNHPLMKKHGILSISHANFFEDPKEPTAFRAYNFRLAVPVKLKDGTESHQVVELLVTPRQLNEIYKITHPYKEKYEEIYNKANGRELTQEEQDAARFCALNLWLMNSLATQSYNSLLKPELKKYYEITKNIKKAAEEEIQYLAAKIRRDHDTTLSGNGRKIELIGRKQEKRLRYGSHDHNGKTTFTRASYVFPELQGSPQPKDFIGRVPVLVEVFDFAKGGFFPVKEGGIKLISSVNHEFAEPREIEALTDELNIAIERYAKEHPELDKT